jgi:uncharacterized iron-regulated membrane protein
MRATALYLHRLLGIVTSIMLVVISLTGSILIYAHSMEPALHLQWHQVQPQGDRASLQQVVMFLTQQFPQDRLDWLALPPTPSDPIQVRLQAPKQTKTDVYLNPYSLETLGQYTPDRWWIHWANQLHTRLLAGPIGRWLVGFCGIALLVLSLSGLPLWNGWKKLTAGFKIRWQAKGRLLNYDLHKVGGVVAAIALVLFSATGSLLAFDKPLQHLGLVLNREQPVAQAILVKAVNLHQSSITKQLYTLDQLLETAQSAFPHATPTRIQFPKKEQFLVRVRLKHPREIAPEGKSIVEIDRQTNQVTRQESMAEESMTRRIKTWVDVLHGGHYGGWVTLVLYMLSGLVIAAISMTGVGIWWNRTYGLKSSRKQSPI